MKLQAVLATGMIFISPLFSAPSPTLYSSESGQGEIASSTDLHWCMLDLQGRSINKTRLKGSNLDTKAGYQNWNLNLYSVDQSSTSQAPETIIGVGLKSSHLTWSENPHFKESTQYNLTLDAQHKFDVQLPFELHGDAHLELSLQSSQLVRYGYGAVDLYGSHDIDGLEFSLGLYGELGRHSHMLLPVIGLKKALLDKLSVDFMFPYHAVVNYAMSGDSDLYVAARQLRDRQRIRSKGTTPAGIWEYRATTLALGGAYRYHQMLRGHIEVGQAINPRIRCSNASGDHLATYRTRDALFAELALDICF